MDNNNIEPRHQIIALNFSGKGANQSSSIQRRCARVTQRGIYSVKVFTHRRKSSILLEHQGTLGQNVPKKFACPIIVDDVPLKIS